MTTPKREEPPFVSNDWIVDKAREIATDICGPEPVPTPDDFEDDPKSEWHATFDGACKLGFEVQKEHEELVSRLRTEQPKWIRCEDRMPEQYVAVLTVTPVEDDHICVAYLERDGTWTRVDHAEKAEYPVTHWMPLPDPPAL